MKTDHESPDLKTALRLNTVCLVLAAVALALAFAGCSKPWWELRFVPTTETERAAVAEQVRMIMLATPRTLSGDDQDWDDAIEAAHRSACQSICRPTMWEKYEYAYTGNWRYLDEPAAPAKKTNRL